MKHLIRHCQAGAAFLLALSPVVSQAQVVGGIDFSFLSGDPFTAYSAKGKPLTGIVNISSELPSDVLTNIYSMLPESQLVNPAYIDQALASNIVIKDSSDLSQSFTHATVSVTFLNEGAGYRNAFGYFIYDSSAPPQSRDEINHVVVFPNSSHTGGDAGEMVQGDQIDLNIQLTAGQAVGFFIVPNGWGYGSDDGKWGSLQYLGPWNQPFYSLPALNPEPDGLKEHNVLFYDAANQFFVIGFDDQHRNYGDNDFNDLLFTVDVSPVDAVEGVNEDGSVNASSYQLLSQTDTTITSTSYYPSQGSNGTWLFEDRWPEVGDYDFNDLVVSYNFTNVADNQGHLMELTLEYTIQAMGASYHNGLALRFPGIPASAIASASLSYGGEVVSQNILRPGNEASIDLTQPWIDSKAMIDSLSQSDCRFFRTQVDCTENEIGPFTASLTFDRSVFSAGTVMPLPPYDPYLFAIDGRNHGLYGGDGWEVHMKQFGGSEHMVSGFFNAADDASGSAGYFINQNNFPWVLNITDEFDHVKEGTDINAAYPDFQFWVESAGETHKNWYIRSNAVTQKLYE